MSLDFKRILCTVDMSPFSREAIKLGVKIAQNSDATLYLLHNWADVLSKYDGVPIIGGMKVSGTKMYDDVQKEIAKLESEMISTFSMPSCPGWG